MPFASQTCDGHNQQVSEEIKVGSPPTTPHPAAMTHALSMLRFLMFRRVKLSQLVQGFTD